LILIGETTRPVVSSEMRVFLSEKSIRIVSCACTDIANPDFPKSNLAWIASAAKHKKPYAFLSDDSGSTLWSGPQPNSVPELEKAIDSINPRTRLSTDRIRVYFSPAGGCERAIIDEIRNAKRSVLVQAYHFTSNPIAIALREAVARGVFVEVILDKSQQSSSYTRATFLHNSGCRVLFDRNHKIAHNKIILLDDDIVITGSYNFTKSAEKDNAENLLIIRDAAIAKTYLSEYNIHRDHSIRFSAKTESFSSPCPAGTCPAK
jgi:phosphatidylserine/phosphatidylglycerophosphate/cardiolipin synthase-like enzyme